jgi:hypothetical protein
MGRHRPIPLTGWSLVRADGEGHMLLFRVHSWSSARPKGEPQMKDLLPCSAAAQQLVTDQTGGKCSCGSRLGLTLLPELAGTSRKRNVLFSFSGLCGPLKWRVWKGFPRRCRRNATSERSAVEDTLLLYFSGHHSAAHLPLPHGGQGWPPGSLLSGGHIYGWSWLVLDGQYMKKRPDV